MSQQLVFWSNSREREVDVVCSCQSLSVYSHCEQYAPSTEGKIGSYRILKFSTISIQSLQSRIMHCGERSKEDANRAQPRGPQMILVIDYDLAQEDIWKEPEMQVDIMATELVHGKPYTSPTLRPSKGKEVAKPRKETYLFDISQADQIFDCLVKEKQIKLTEAHKIPPADELKGKKYYKWHHSWTHTTNNCTIFRNSIHKALKEGTVKLAEKGDVIVDTNPFGLSINMVSVSITRKEQKKVPRWEKKLKEKDEAGPSRKIIWRPRIAKPQETGGSNTNQRVSVFQRLQYLGQFQGRIGYHSQSKRESSHPNPAKKAKNKKGKNSKQDAAPKITDHSLPEESKRELHFEKGTPSLKIIVLDNKQ